MDWHWLYVYEPDLTFWELSIQSKHWQPTHFILLLLAFFQILHHLWLCFLYVNLGLMAFTFMYSKSCSAILVLLVPRTLMAQPELPLLPNFSRSLDSSPKALALFLKINAQKQPIMPIMPECAYYAPETLLCWKLYQHNISKPKKNFDHLLLFGAPWPSYLYAFVVWVNGIWFHMRNSKVQGSSVDSFDKTSAFLRLYTI